MEGRSHEVRSAMCSPTQSRNVHYLDNVQTSKCHENTQTHILSCLSTANILWTQRVPVPEASIRSVIVFLWALVSIRCQCPHFVTYLYPPSCDHTIALTHGTGCGAACRQGRHFSHNGQRRFRQIWRQVCAGGVHVCVRVCNGIRY